MTTKEDDELRRRVAAAYDEVLHEPVPERLSNLLTPVVDLAAERERRRSWPRPQRNPWLQWGGLAASLAIGVVVGLQFAAGARSGALLVDEGGRVVAGAPLAQVLETRLAGEPDARIAVQLSFLDGAGRYCRTFSAAALAGLACREGREWNVVATAQAQPAAGGAMRQAASALPRPVLDAVDARIAGSALDAAQERAARDRGWRR